MGIVGQMVDAAVRRYRAETDAENTARATAAAEERMLEMAKADPIGFSERYLSESEARVANAKLEHAKRALLEQQARDLSMHFAGLIGNTMHGVDGWADLSPSEFEELTKDVLAGDDITTVVQKFLPGAISRVVQKRVDKLYADRFQKDLDREVEARVRQRANEARRAERAPSVQRPAAAETDMVEQIRAMDDRTFDTWYQQNVLNAGR